MLTEIIYIRISRISLETQGWENMQILKPFTAPKMPAVLTAGTKDKYNSLIIGYGLLGAAWNKPLFLVLVHPDRYTYEFMENSEYFTVSFIKKDLYKKFVLYGQKSGRDINKEKEAGTHIQFLDNGGITFEEAEEVYVCKMMVKSHLRREELNQELRDLYDEASKRFHQTNEIHGVYIGEIIAHYKR